MDAPLAPPYAIDTILDELTLNPVVFTQGEFREVPPMSGLEVVAFPDPVGTVQAHYTLHSEVATFPLSFASKGIREASFRIAFAQEFSEKLTFLVRLGLAETLPIMVKGREVRPRDLLVAVLSAIESPDAPVDDCDVIRVNMKGEREGKGLEYILEAVVRPHSRWKVRPEHWIPVSPRR